jgi:predicted outer membrane repeat protein
MTTIVKKQIFWILLFFYVKVMNAQQCVGDINTKLSLTALHQIIKDSINYGGEIRICPFLIKNKFCDTEEKPLVISELDVFFYCDVDSSAGTDGEQGCIIDCPGTHFEIKNGRTLFLDHVTLRGATKGSIRVIDGGLMLSYNSKWENNSNENDHGGAIHADTSSIVICLVTDFSRNTAKNKLGGAIYSEGTCQIDVSSFVGNNARYGGAIYGATGSYISIGQSIFEKNKVQEKGPAVCLSQGYHHEYSNYGCMNFIADGTQDVCDGVYNLVSGDCKLFDDFCDMESPFTIITPAPTSLMTSSSPSSKPSKNPTSDPSQMPSASPSLETSAFPTTTPSDYTTTQPSYSPSLLPSMILSNDPSTQATLLPSTITSHTPSSIPSFESNTSTSLSTTKTSSVEPSTHSSSQLSDSPLSYNPTNENLVTTSNSNQESLSALSSNTTESQV